MFYDLNVPWLANDTHHLPRTLAFLHELGYNVVALSHSISGNLPADLSCPIPHPLPFQDLPSALTVLRRCTLTLTASHQNARLAELGRSYDILALRPIDERTLQLACTSLDCDIISLDLTQRLPFWFKHKQLAEAVKLGKRFEICYAQGVAGDATARRNLIGNATQLIRASRGKGLVISSEAKTAVTCRGPWDVINLTTVWGLGQERGYEAVSKECRSVVVGAQLKRTGYRGVVDVVYGGEKPAVAHETEKDMGKSVENRQKRKAVTMEGPGSTAGETDKILSKRQMKRQRKTRLQSVGGAENGASRSENVNGHAES